MPRQPTRTLPPPPRCRANSGAHAACWTVAARCSLAITRWALVTRTAGARPAGCAPSGARAPTTPFVRKGPGAAARPAAARAHASSCVSRTTTAASTTAIVAVLARAACPPVGNARELVAPAFSNVAPFRAGSSAGMVARRRTLCSRRRVASRRSASAWQSSRCTHDHWRLPVERKNELPAGSPRPVRRSQRRSGTSRDVRPAGESVTESAPLPMVGASGLTCVLRPG